MVINKIPMSKPAKSRRSLVLLGVFGLFLGVGCATPHTNPHMQLIPESEYFSLVESATEKTEQYQGLQNVLSFYATLMSSKVGLAYFDQKARLYQWDQAKYSVEKSKWSEAAKNSTEVVISFYTPERKHDDLDKSETLWKTFLDVNGKRYEGKAKKLKFQVAETKAFFPTHNRWSTAYTLTFPVPVATVDLAIAGDESAKVQLTVTGPVASSSVTYSSGR